MYLMYIFSQVLILWDLEGGLDLMVGFHQTAIDVMQKAPLFKHSLIEIRAALEFRSRISHLNMNVIGHQWNDTKHPLNHCSKVWLDGTFLSLELPVILLFRTSWQITEKFHFDANIHLIRCPFLIFSQTIFPVAKSEPNLSKMRMDAKERNLF